MWGKEAASSMRNKFTEAWSEEATIRIENTEWKLFDDGESQQHRKKLVIERHTLDKEVSIEFLISMVILELQSRVTSGRGNISSDPASLCSMMCSNH